MSTSPATVGSVEIEPGEARWGLLEMPANPPASHKVVVNPEWTPGRLIREVLRRTGWLGAAAATLFSIFKASEMLVPLLIGSVVDSLVTPLANGAPIASLTGVMVWSAAAVIGLYVVMNVTYRFAGRFGWRAAQRASYELSQQVVERALDERGARRARPSGELLSIATADVRRVIATTQLLVYPPGDLVALTIAAVALFTINGWLGLSMLVGLPVVFLVMRFAARPLITRSIKEQSDIADAASSAADLLAGFRVLRGLRAHGVAASRYRTISRTALDSTLSARSASAMLDGLQSVAGQLLAAGIVCVAAALAVAGDITPGQLVVAAGIAVSILFPLQILLVETVEWIAQGRASAGRLLQMLRDDPNPASIGTTQLPASDAPVVQFDSLRLPGGITLTETIKPGEMVVFSMPQSACAQLASVLSLDSVADGGASIAGAEVSTLRASDVRSRVLTLPRTPGMFAGSVIDNASANGSLPVARARTEQALRDVQLREEELPNGYQTIVGDGGFELSGGQRQRLALARALAANADVLVLQDPTTSVDAVTEQRIADALYRSRAGKTTIVLGASPALTNIADRVVRVNARAEGAEESA